MSLDHTMILGCYRSGFGFGNMLKVAQGTHLAVPVHQPFQSPFSQNDYAKLLLVWNGNVYAPIGSESSGSFGWAKFNHELNKFEVATNRSVVARHIPVLDRVGHFASGYQGWGTSPENYSGYSGANAANANDYVVVANRVYVCDKASGNRTVMWDYPFNSAPSNGPVHPMSYMWRYCELNGEIYCVGFDTTKLYLYKFTPSSWLLVGTGTVHANLANYQGAYLTQAVLYKLNGKLFFAITGATTGIAPAVRLWEVDAVTGNSIERTNAWLPAGWLGLCPSNYAGLFEVRDEISNSEQVFLVHCPRGTAGWTCYEAHEGAFTLVDTGTETISPWCGVIYDPSAKAAQVKSAVDTIPSDYVDARVKTYDLAANGSVDIDPRHRWNYAEPPPYTQCSEKGGVGSEGVLALSSKPSSIAVLADLSDDFNDDVLDAELWERYDPTLPSNVRDGGAMYSAQAPSYSVHEGNGAVRFGRLTDSNFAAYTGAGVRGKYFMRGAFQITAQLKHISNLTSDSTPNYPLIFLVRVTPNEGYGFIVWKSSTLGLRIRGVLMQQNTNFVVTADVACANDAYIRISRAAGTNVWTLTYDPTGTPVDLTPPGGVNYSQPVLAVMGCLTSSTLNWVLAGSPVGLEPGIGDVVVSALDPTGLLGLYTDGIEHKFCWDHITDLGANKTGMAELFVDTQRT